MNRRQFVLSGSLAGTAIAANLGSGEWTFPKHKVIGIGPDRKLKSWGAAVKAAWGHDVEFQAWATDLPDQEHMDVVLQRGRGGLLILAGRDIAWETVLRRAPFEHVLLDQAPARNRQSFCELQEWAIQHRRQLYWLTDWRMDSAVHAETGVQFTQCCVECPANTLEESLAWSDLAHLLAPRGLPEQVFAAQSNSGHMAGVLTWPGQTISWQQKPELNRGWCSFATADRNFGFGLRRGDENLTNFFREFLARPRDFSLLPESKAATAIDRYFYLTQAAQQARTLRSVELAATPSLAKI